MNKKTSKSSTFTIEKINFQETGYFSTVFSDYIEGKDSLLPFYNQSPTEKGLAQKIAVRQFPESNRELLHQVVVDQYAGLKIPEALQKNIGLLADKKTLAVTTGHQLNILTGPLYFIYKIITAVKLAETLSKQHPEYNFVPMYRPASEDHDFEEINHIHLFGNRYEWHADQKGATGRFDPRTTKTFFEQLPEPVPELEACYLGSKTLSEAVRKLLILLFGDVGLIMIDADDARLKAVLKPVIRDELLNGESFRLINETTDELTTAGYKAQLHPRELNLFYLEEDLRERIIREGDTFKVLNTELSFSKEEILELVDSNPEKFSPNAALYPVYQALILPEVSYVGGPGEIAYRLQLKEAFEHFKAEVPVLFPRMSGLIITERQRKKIEKYGLTYIDLFKTEKELKDQFLQKTGGKPPSLQDELLRFRQIFEKIKDKAVEIDKTLEGAVKATEVRTENELTKLEKRLQKAEENKFETELKGIFSIKNQLFPDGGLQERHDNFLTFYLNNPSFIADLTAVATPFDLRFAVFFE